MRLERLAWRVLTTFPPFTPTEQGGFVPVNDQGDAYKLLYPFGWQEVSVSGQDIVYKVQKKVIDISIELENETGKKQYAVLMAPY